MRRSGRGAGHRLSSGGRPARPGHQAHPGRAGPPAAACGRRRPGPPRRPADGGLGPGAVDLQSGPRHPAGRSDRPCRTGAEADRRPMTKAATNPEGRPNRRVAVVLTNLGGPDRPEAVKPFLFNLFNDPAIIGLPGVFRTPLAKLISSRRETSPQANDALMGGGPPLLPETQKQAESLSRALADSAPGDDSRVFIAMRYWHPLTEEAAAAVKAFQPDKIVLLPLYPQFSTTTTASSLKK